MKFLFLILLSALYVYASVGKISALNGKIIIDRDKKQFDADVGTLLEEKDIISSDDKSKAQITMNDGTVLTIGKSSKLNIYEYVLDEKNPQESKADFKFVEGTFKSITGAIGKVAPERFKLETKSASIGIRGTIVVGNQEKVACTQGQITVTSAGVTQVLGAGMMTTTEVGKAPTTPTKIEGNLLKEVDNVGAKEDNKSTTTEKVESQNQQSSNSKPATTENSVTQTSPVSNLSSLGEVANTVNNTNQNSTNTKTVEISKQKADEVAQESKQKADAIASAELLATQATTVTKSINDAVSTVTTTSTTVNSITKSIELDSSTQTSVDIVSSATTTVNTISAQALALQNEIVTLIEKMKLATADEAVNIYKQIQVKTDSLNTIVTQATNIVTNVQNSLKSISYNLSNILATQSTLTLQNIITKASLTQTSTNDVSKITNNASTSALNEISSLQTATNMALANANNLSAEAQVLKDEISKLFSQLQSANSSDVVSIYNDIKTKSDLLNTKLANITIESAMAETNLQNISKAIANVPFYSTTVSILNSNNGVGAKTFNVGSSGSTVTIATYASSDTVLDPVLILLKLNNSTGKYETVANGRNDDGWIVAKNYYNSILHLTLTEGTYKILVSDFPFSDTEALDSANHGKYDEGTISLYFTSTTDLVFDETNNSSVEKYSYITRYNNEAYVSDAKLQVTILEESNAKFGILADSKVGTAISIDNYGYFVTISDSFDTTKNAFLNSTEVEDGSSWGYWGKTLLGDDRSSQSYVTDMQSVWVSGNKVTPPTGYKATFTGQVIGSVNHDGNRGYIILDSNNQFKATIDIGNASITNSLIKFNDSLNGTWSGVFDNTGTTVNTSGFSANITNPQNFIPQNSISSESISSTKIVSTTGTISGNYYGVNNQVKSIGGAFNMSQGVSTANGVFKARAQ